MDLFADGSAVLSDCGRYRYRLDRTMGWPGPVFAFFGINPSTADASIDDATVRKWRGFTRRWNGSRFIVGNVFAYRATDVRELAKAEDPVGPLNSLHLIEIAAAADVLVPCWGDRNKVPQQLRRHIDDCLDLLHDTGKPVKSFGLSKGGDPLHPLMLGYATELVHLAA